MRENKAINSLKKKIDVNLEMLFQIDSWIDVWYTSQIHSTIHSIVY